MALNDLMLLDCTLRDGGYVNNWKWGFHQARSIIQALVKAKVDVVEVGITATSTVGRIFSVILGIYGIIVVSLITSIIVNFYGEVRNEDEERRHRRFSKTEQIEHTEQTEQAEQPDDTEK